MSGPSPVGAQPPAGAPAAAAPAQPAIRHFEIDEEDPIDFIEKEVLKASGQPDLQHASFEISGKYQRENGKIKASSFGDPPRICFQKVYTANFKDQHGNDHELTFEKTIYTSVRFPNFKGGEQDFNNAIKLAAMAASLYGKSIKNTLLQKAGKPIDPAFAGKLSQIQRDGFIRLEFFRDGKEIGDPLKAMRKNRLDFSQITEVRLTFSPNAAKNSMQHIAPVSIKVNQVFKKNQKGFLERIAAKEFTIGVDHTTPSYIQDAAQARKVKDILHGDPNAPLDDQLKSHQLSKSTYFKQLQTDFSAKMKEFEQRQAFFRDLKEINNLKERYGEATDPALSQDTLMLLFNKMPKVPKLEKLKFWKTKSRAPLLKAITELKNDPNLDKGTKDELNLLDKYLALCFDEMNRELDELTALKDELLKYQDSCSEKTKDKVFQQYRDCSYFFGEIGGWSQNITY